MTSPMSVMIQTKQLMNDLIDVVFQASWEGGLDLDRGTLEAEFEAVGTYVAGSDNNISSEEIELLNFLFDLSLTPREVPGLIDILSGMYDMIIVQLQMPGWLVCKAIDEAQGSRQATDLYIQTMELVMNLFAAIDGNTDRKEEKFINDFISRMKRDRY